MSLDEVFKKMGQDGQKKLEKERKQAEMRRKIGQAAADALAQSKQNANENGQFANQNGAGGNVGQ